MQHVLLGAVEREAGEGGLAESVGTSEGRDTDDGDVHRLRCLNHRAIADVELSGLGGATVEHDLVGRLWSATVDELVGVERRRADPTAGLTRWTIASNRLAVRADERSVSEHLRFDDGDSVDTAHAVDQAGVDRTSSVDTPCAAVDRGRVAHDDVGAG
jgi:hypothetical protein